jgi:hypothetical protein
MTNNLTNTLSLVPIRIEMCFHNEVLATGTAFTYTFQEKTYLITNWHNVTGREPDKLKCKHTESALPNCITANIPYITGGNNKPTKIRWEKYPVALYKDTGDTTSQAVWYEHPIYQRQVDVVAIPIDLSSNLSEEKSIWHGRDYPMMAFIENGQAGELEISRVPAVCPANHAGLGLKNIRLETGLDVFVLGFPRGMSGGAEFPIWKRGSIASEPGFDINNLPKMLIDTATREGMSGAPVYALSRPFSGLDDKDVNGKPKIFAGYAERFIGIYSGRIGSDVFQAQLGIVWKPPVIDEIIEGKMIGRSSFELQSVIEILCKCRFRTRFHRGFSRAYTKFWPLSNFIP